MNFKKLALIAAMATSFGAFAADVGVLPAAEDSAYAAADAQPLLQTELVADTAAVEGNQAYVVQEGLGSLAYISQATEEGSFAAIVQIGVGALGLVYQTGTLGNKALIVQRGAADAANDVAAYDVTAADTDIKAIALVKGALLPTPVVVMNEDANVALINQTSDGGFNVAYIDQSVGDATVDGNFAAIVQNAGVTSNLGMIAQIGSFNKAFIHQSN